MPQGSIPQATHKINQKNISLKEKDVLYVVFVRAFDTERYWNKKGKNTENTKPYFAF